MSNAPKQLQNAKVSVFSLNSSGAISALGVVQLDSTGGIVSGGAGGGSTQVSIRGMFTDGSSNASLLDSTNNSVGVTIRAGSAAGTEYTDGDVDATVSGQAILFDNSSNTLRPVTITRGLPVNIVQGQSTITTVSTGSVRVHQSTAADLNVTVAGYVAPSTITTVSTGSVRVHQSTAADLAATVTLASSANSVLARVTTSSGGGVEGSTVAAHGNLLGLHVRPVLPTLLSTTLVITSTHSTAVYPLISSAAGVRHKVYAYFVGSTHTHPSTLIFCSSASDAGFDHFPVNFGSGSSGITGANLAVTPPGFLFAGIVANALNVKIEGGSSAASTTIVRIGISYFSEA